MNNSLTAPTPLCYSSPRPYFHSTFPLGLLGRFLMHA